MSLKKTTLEKVQEKLDIATQALKHIRMLRPGSHIAEARGIAALAARKMEAVKGADRASP